MRPSASAKIATPVFQTARNAWTSCSPSIGGAASKTSWPSSSHNRAASWTAATQSPSSGLPVNMNSSTASGPAGSSRQGSTGLVVASSLSPPLLLLALALALALASGSLVGPALVSGSTMAVVPASLSGSTVSAGGVVSALVSGLAQGQPPQQAFAQALATSAAALLSHGTALAEPADVARLLPQVTVVAI